MESPPAAYPTGYASASSRPMVPTSVPPPSPPPRYRPSRRRQEFRADTRSDYRSDRDRQDRLREEGAAILGQVLEELQGLRDLVAHAATKEDLRLLLPREVYDAYHKQVVDDNRINNEAINTLRARVDTEGAEVRRQLADLQEKFHAQQLADAARYGQVKHQTQTGIATVKASSAEMFNRLLIPLVSILGGGLASALIALLTHH